MASGQYEQMGFRSPKHNCAICGLPYYQDEMVLKNGKWVCSLCDDQEENDR